MTTAISKKTPVTIGLVLLICGGCVWVGVTYNGFGNRIDNLERAIRDSMDSHEELTLALHKALAEHATFRNNLTLALHKALAEHATFRNDLNAKTKDRWAKINDQAFMREYSRINKLIMVPHERVFDITLDSHSGHRSPQL